MTGEWPKEIIDHRDVTAQINRCARKGGPVILLRRPCCASARGAASVSIAGGGGSRRPVEYASPCSADIQAVVWTLRCSDRIPRSAALVSCRSAGDLPRCASPRPQPRRSASTSSAVGSAVQRKTRFAVRKEETNKRA